MTLQEQIREDLKAAMKARDLEKNKMQAMGDIMRYFGSRADGRTVKAVLQGMDE